MDEITIRISKSGQEPGYFFDIYKFDAIDECAEPYDGGICTTSMKNAVDMACEQAKLLTN